MRNFDVWKCLHCFNLESKSLFWKLSGKANRFVYFSCVFKLEIFNRLKHIDPDANVFLGQISEEKNQFKLIIAAKIRPEHTISI